MNCPNLSVVIPNYNHGRYLPICLEAILQQSIAPKEIILLDDASTDNSREIIHHFLHKYPSIRFYQNEKNLGVVACLNRGLELAQNEYIYYAAADDQVLPGFFEKSLHLLANYPEAGLSCTICHWRELDTGLDRHVGVGIAKAPCYLSPAQLVKLEQRGKLLISPHTVIMKRQELWRSGKFIPELRWHCDWFAIQVTAFRHGICFLPEVLTIFNMHPSSFSARGVQEKSHQLMHRTVLGKILDLLLSPDYRDVCEAIRNSGALFFFGGPMFWLIVRHPRYRRFFLTMAYCLKVSWQMFRMQVKKITPRFMANWYFYLCGYRVKTGRRSR